MRRLLAGLVCLPLLMSVARAEDLTVLTDVDGAPPKQMMGRYLKGLADEALKRRRNAYEALKTPEQLAERQQKMRAAFIEHLGGFPERTPLGAKVVGTIDGDGYRVENVIYESQPRHYVTANLYLPKGEGPFPGVLLPCGHSRDGKMSSRRTGALLAKYGIAALCYDPIGQGERYQLLNAEGKPRFKPTDEHTLIGSGCIPLGKNTATYRIWDGMRSIDYLAGRKEVDGERIGVTGCSGGGTLTSYLMALDDRVACAAPSCYLTSFRRLLETIGPQDAEQNIHGQIALGMDHADYVMMRAPKPTLILASTRDFFDIEGTWDTFRQAKRFYTRLGFAERVGLLEADAKHGYPQLHREGMLRWMRRWLTGIDEPATEPDFETLPADKLQCMPRGQVMLIDGARSVVDLNVELNRKLAGQRAEAWKPANREKTLAEVRRLAGIRGLADLPKPEVSAVGNFERDGYRAEKLDLRPEPGIHLPALLFRPAGAAKRRCLYLNGEGKHVDAQPGGPIEGLVRAGHLVLVVDLRGTGETGPGGGGMWGGNWNDVFTVYLLGKSFVGMRAEDVLGAARYLAGLEGGDRASGIDIVAIGVAGPPALHAAALEPQLFGNLELKQSLASWSAVVANPGVGGQLGNVIHGALRVYDLPDLVGLLPAEKVKIEEPVELAE